VQLLLPVFLHGSRSSCSTRAVLSNRAAMAVRMPRSKSHGYGFSQTDLIFRSPASVYPYYLIPFAFWPVPGSNMTLPALRWFMW
jgi:hypothetical protein